MAVFAACPVARDQDAALVVGRFDRQFAADGSWIMRILLGSRDAANDREAFLTTQLFFWQIAAPDGHAKNFSVFIERGGRLRLTPMYDMRLLPHPDELAEEIIAPQTKKSASFTMMKSAYSPVPWSQGLYQRA